ncbi:zinc ribbon domain-containing protein [Dethiosulfatarculus sandiegensis]|uniref:DZANK-type domain-containing protein n=1 Tax=Dethiosulfatarculus sandiegensis TaxID=1429043 RepID=A0A0D2JBT6_9BACT|nr:zinc ribbon domain-containing protein [Dethiosulfatarculus sandiegensis]KIX13251.1 hypothetical protein X474_14685 [Dethiosulfatarculus sandiegensis]
MNCPHCEKELPGQTCPQCGQPTLEGANFCPQCGHQLALPAGEEPKLIECSSCNRPLLPEFDYCPSCGHSRHAEPEEQDQDQDDFTFDPSERIACSDGLCIGIIGPDGKCTECGKPYKPEVASEEPLDTVQEETNSQPEEKKEEESDSEPEKKQEEEPNSRPEKKQDTES